jgi:putative ABC transport system ATP-binding protein
MHILGLLDRPTGGVYKFDGHNVQDLDDNQLAIMRNEKIGFVFQAFNLLPRTTVLENVKLPLLYSKKKIDADARAKEVLTSVGLEHRFDYFTNQISGGEKQRVAIARALVNDPEIIFADEPTGNLDSKSGIQVMEIFQKLNDMGHTVILVTHETATAEYADRIIRVRDGQIIGDEKVLNKRRGEGDGQLK